jgi:hypothetical protein
VEDCWRLQGRRNFGSFSLWGPRSRFGATSQMLLPPVVLTSLGSASNRVLSGGWGGQHASLQKFEACATIHFSLENFESVDLALGLAVAPALCHRVSYRVDILPQCSDEALHYVQTGLPGVVEPGVEFIALLLRRMPRKRMPS